LRSIDRRSAWSSRSRLRAPSCTSGEYVWTRVTPSRLACRRAMSAC
jgi:hypothetical protein